MGLARVEDKLRISWMDAVTYVQLLADHIALSEFVPRTIVAVAKGGVVPAGILHQHFPDATLRIISVSSYKEGHQQGELSIDWQGFPNELDWEDTLVVDDICDSGQTLMAIKTQCPRVRTGVMLWRFKLNFVFTPDFRGTSLTTDRWVQFPWEHS